MIVVLLRKDISTTGELTDATIVVLKPNSSNFLYNENFTKIFPTFCKFIKFMTQTFFTFRVEKLFENELNWNNINVVINNMATYLFFMLILLFIFFLNL